MIIGTFAPIPNEILRRKDLSHGAKLCCARLIQYAGKDGKAFPKLSTLGDELGMSKRAFFGIVWAAAAEKLRTHSLILSHHRLTNGYSTFLVTFSLKQLFLSRAIVLLTL